MLDPRQPSAPARLPATMCRNGPSEVYDREQEIVQPDASRGQRCSTHDLQALDGWYKLHSSKPRKPLIVGIK